MAKGRLKEPLGMGGSDCYFVAREAFFWSVFPHFSMRSLLLSVLILISGTDGCGKVQPRGRADGQSILAFT